MAAWYRVGTVNVVQLSDVVNATGTLFQTTGIKPGDLFSVGLDGPWYEIEEVLSETQFTLQRDYAEVSGNDLSYFIIPIFSATTNAQLAARLSALVLKWENREDELQAWQGGSATGGPNLDGYFPLTDLEGNVTLVRSPARYDADLIGFLKVDGTLPMTGSLAVNGAATYATVNADQAYPIKIGGNSNPSIELGKPAPGGALTPFIDFHSAADSGDYDVRLIASGGSSTVGQGLLTIQSVALALAGQLRGADGSALVPGLSFVTDLDTGLFRPDANRLGFVTGGAARMYLDSAGALKIAYDTEQAYLGEAMKAGIVGALRITELGEFSDSSAYLDAGVGVTRASASAGKAWFSMTRTGQTVYGIGIDSSNRIVLGGVAAGGALTPSIMIDGAGIVTAISRIDAPQAIISGQVTAQVFSSEGTDPYLNLIQTDLAAGLKAWRLDHTGDGTLGIRTVADDGTAVSGENALTFERGAAFAAVSVTVAAQALRIARASAESIMRFVNAAAPTSERVWNMKGATDGLFKITAVTNDEVTETEALTIDRSGTTILGMEFKGTFLNIPSASDYRVNNLPVVKARKTGWGAPTGTVARTTFATYTNQDISNPPTEAQVQAINDHVLILSQRLAALITDLHSSGSGHALLTT